MPRPPAAPSDACVDADACARAGSVIERHFSAADLPRLNEVGVDVPALEARFAFSQFDDLPAVEGALHGEVVLTCQRCMRPVAIALDERFQVLLVRAERSDEPGGYEPVIADPARLDLRWLAEEQALLALPLVPMHEGDECNEVPAQAGDRIRQQPFQNLRDLLRDRHQ